jgi:hypothetical protein
MKGKHASYPRHLIAHLYREILRWRIKNIVAWAPLAEYAPGCTVVIGVCSRLPHVLAANIRCLDSSRWTDLKEVIAVVDGRKGSLPQGLEQGLIEAYPELKIRFLYYSDTQATMAEKLKLPYFYSWLSWCIGISQTKTDHVLIHDYDALILGQTLKDRYDSFVKSKAKVQGIAWYKVNGINVDDRLATTFEAYFSTEFLHSVKPIELFNKLHISDGRSIDFDTTLDIQFKLLKRDERQIMPMNEAELVHPSQMIHQYTMFRRNPKGDLPSYSIPMIPFFAYLSGNRTSIESALNAMSISVKDDMDFLGDGTRINFNQLGLAHVDWTLKQIVQALVILNAQPDPEIYKYGVALYKMVGSTDADIWRGDFTDDQRRWIESAIKC